jgi:hypothetical protein
MNFRADCARRHKGHNTFSYPRPQRFPSFGSTNPRKTETQSWRDDRIF